VGLGWGGLGVWSAVWCVAVHILCSSVLGGAFWGSGGLGGAGLGVCVGGGGGVVYWLSTSLFPYLVALALARVVLVSLRAGPRPPHLTPLSSADGGLATEIFS